MRALAVSAAVFGLAWFAAAPRSRPWGALRGLDPLGMAVGSSERQRSVLRSVSMRRHAVEGHWRRARRADAVSHARTAEVPIVADLLAVAVAAGLPIRQGLIDVAAVLHARDGARPVVTGGDRLTRGAELPAVLDTIAQAGAGWHSLATHLSLSVDSGASAESTLWRLAAQERLRIRRERERRARRLPVLLLLPLTMMVLPAFVLVTVVPFVVAGGTSLDLPQVDQGDMGNHD